MPAPATEGDADGAGASGSELQAARGGHGQTGHFGDDPAKPAMAQTFLEAGENRLLIARLDIDHAVRRQPRLRDRRGEKILAGYAPQDLAARPRRDASREKRGCQCLLRGLRRAEHRQSGAVDCTIEFDGHRVDQREDRPHVQEVGFEVSRRKLSTLERRGDPAAFFIGHPGAPWPSGQSTGPPICAPARRGPPRRCARRRPSPRSRGARRSPPRWRA